MREIKRRRNQNTPSDAPVTLEERRAVDRASITEIIKDHRNLLTTWTSIMENCLRDQ